MKFLVLVLLFGSRIYAAGSVKIAQPEGDTRPAQRIILTDDERHARSLEKHSRYLQQLDAGLKAESNANAQKAIAYLKASLKNKKGKDKYKKPVRKIDLWLYNPKPEDSFIFTSKIKRVRQDPPPANEMDKWLPLRIGDVIYYTGAFGAKDAAHAGTYIGNGWTLEKWYEGGNLLGDARGVVVINRITNFASSRNELRSISAKECLTSKSFNCATRCIKVEPNRFRQVFHVQKAGQRLQRTPELLIKALEEMTHGEVAYNPLYDNCIRNAADVSQSRQTVLSAFLQTLHFTCQKRESKELRPCLKQAESMLKWGAFANKAAGVAVNLAIMATAVKMSQIGTIE